MMTWLVKKTRLAKVFLNGGKRDGMPERDWLRLGDEQYRTCEPRRWNRCDRQQCRWLYGWCHRVPPDCIRPWRHLRPFLPIGPWHHRCGSPSRRSWTNTWVVTATLKIRERRMLIKHWYLLRVSGKWLEVSGERVIRKYHLDLDVIGSPSKKMWLDIIDNDMKTDGVKVEVEVE